jgi:hypothetical protein
MGEWLKLLNGANDGGREGRKRRVERNGQFLGHWKKTIERSEEKEVERA